MRSTRIRSTLLMACAIALLGVAAPATAATVSWDIDEANSFIRLNVPDQAIDLDGTNATIRLRNQTSASGGNNTWSDNQGKLAFLDGTIATNYTDGSSVEFLTGQNNIQALEAANIRPDPASFNPNNTNADNPDGQYSGSASALAAFGARVRATVSILTVDVAFLAIRDVLFDLSSNSIALGGGTTIANGTTSLGIASALIDADGLSLPLGLGQPIPDTFGAAFDSGGNFANTTGGTITIVDPMTRKLTLTVTVPIALDISGVILNASAVGQIVAYAVVPEPSSFALLGFGTAALGVTVYRRRRSR